MFLFLILKEFYIKKFNFMILELLVWCSQAELEVLTGLMLSDGNIRNPNKHKRGTGNCRFACTFKAAHFDFVCWLKFDILANFCTKTQPTGYPKESPTQFWFCSKNTPLFTALEKIWYISKEDKVVKVLPSESFLEKVFTPLCLAHMIMGDGYWDNSNRTVMICTECFSYEEVCLLIKLLHKNLGLKATLKKRVNNGVLVGHRIRFSSSEKNLEQLRFLVKDFMHTSMLYKLNLSIPLQIQKRKKHKKNRKKR